MSSISHRIEGLAELEDALLNRTVGQARSAMRSALGDAGKFMRVELSLHSPVRTGFLARHMVSKTQLSVKNDEGKVSVGPSREAFYVGFIEFGTVHQPPRPFITTTFNENKEIMTEYFARKLRENLGL